MYPFKPCSLSEKKNEVKDFSKQTYFISSFSILKKRTLSVYFAKTVGIATNKIFKIFMLTSSGKNQMWYF